MSSITVFSFDSQDIRVIEIEGQPWWIGQEVAEFLGYSNTRDAILYHVDAEDTLIDASVNSTHGLSYQTKLINESGLYSLILGSRLEGAKRFKRWITKEVIPSIRKTSSYSLSPSSTADMFLMAAQGLKEHEVRLNQIEEKHQVLANKMEPYLPDEGYFTFAAFLKRNKFHTVGQAGSLIALAAIRRAKKFNIPLGEVSDTFKGDVKTYPEKLLQITVDELIRAGTLTATKKIVKTWLSVAA